MTALIHGSSTCRNANSYFELPHAPVGPIATSTLSDNLVPAATTCVATTAALTPPATSLRLRLEMKARAARAAWAPNDAFVEALKSGYLRAALREEKKVVLRHVTDKEQTLAWLQRAGFTFCEGSETAYTQDMAGDSCPYQTPTIEVDVTVKPCAEAAKDLETLLAGQAHEARAAWKPSQQLITRLETSYEQALLQGDKLITLEPCDYDIPKCIAWLERAGFTAQRGTEQYYSQDRGGDSVSCWRPVVTVTVNPLERQPAASRPATSL